MSLKQIIRAQKQSDLIITPKLQAFLMNNPQLYFDESIGDFIRDVITTQPRVRSGSFSASSAGMCQRRQVFSYLGIDSGGVNGFQLQNIFEDGKWRHLRWQAILLQAGLLDKAEVPLDWPKMRSKGSMDGQGTVPDDHPRKEWRGMEYGFELKGVSPYVYDSYIQQGGKIEHKKQVHRYFLASGVDLFVILYENKATQVWHEWVIEPDSLLLKEQQDELDELNESVVNEQLPPILSGCQVAKGTEYNQCPYGKNSGVCSAMKDQWPVPVTIKKKGK
jgi:hypothetical protein